MHKTARILALATIAFCAFSTALHTGNATAQELEKRQISDMSVPIPNSGYTISFIRKPGTPENEAIIKITQPIAINGCLTINMPPAEKKMTGPKVTIMVAAPIVKADKTPQYGNATCKRQTPNVTTDIAINRDTLIARNVDKIEFAGPGGSDTYDLYADQHKIYLYKKVRDAERGVDVRVDYFDDKFFFKPLETKNRHAPLTHWFLPENVVILDVPAAKQGQHLTEQIETLAGQQGFIKLETFLQGHEPATTNKNTLYFVDQTGITAKSLHHDSKIPFGTVIATQTLHGPNGPYEREETLTVMARRPGTFE